MYRKLELAEFQSAYSDSARELGLEQEKCPEYPAVERLIRFLSHSVCRISSAFQTMRKSLFSFTNCLAERRKHSCRMNTLCLLWTLASFTLIFVCFTHLCFRLSPFRKPFGSSSMHIYGFNYCQCIFCISRVPSNSTN